MRKLLKVVNEAHACAEDIRTHAEGLDSEVLLEAMFLDDADFSEPTDAEAFLASMRKDALL